MRFVFIIFVILSGCAMDEPRFFNVDDLQDQKCYASFGGEWGYCDKTYEEVK